ncbi:MAG TPA: hybrid sensor histidine kinase/response regulator [Geobacter sp.]|nr:hybrid sensor histidine kinase/response regulator [Geobacter sp.]HCE68797.1 hybrid sensor histidine kinase/response regulator [Geobacter sp.]
MIDKDAEFLKRLLVTFKVEADEHLKGMCSGLLELEQGALPERQTELVEFIFREAHSLKGAARAVNQVEIEALCQALESIFASLKKNELTASPGLFDLLQEALDLLARTLPDAGAERAHDDKALQRRLINRLEQAGKGGSGETGKRRNGEALKGGSGEVVKDRTGETEKRGNGADEECLPDSPFPRFSDSGKLPDSPIHKISTDTVRVSTARLTSVLLQSEEMLSAKLASSQHVLDLRATATAFDSWSKEWARVKPLVQKFKSSKTQGENDEATHKKRSLTRLLDFLDWNSDFMKSLETRFTAEVKSAERDSRALGGMTNNLLEDMKKVLMFPFSSLLEILPKIVRDLSRENGKKIELTISGDDIEIDRRILEEMKDPLVHLVRNCIDHGIENPAERRAKGKPQLGTIRIAVLPRDDKVELTIADDGGGIALDGIRSALLKSGMLSAERVAELSDQELMTHVFQSGITTSPIITEISGRGLGLAIVREKVEKLGGSVSVESTTCSGTSFRIVLPLTVATFRGILVRLGERLFVLPAMYVARVLRIRPNDIKCVENRETICLDGAPVSLARLATVLELPVSGWESKPSDLLPVVLLATSETRIAFQVDEVLGELEVLLKGLGRQLSRVRNVAGATVLGNGHVAPILNVTDLFKSAVKSAAYSSQRSAVTDTGEPANRLRSVLVVEDSITTRTLLKNILESSGYAVVTAVDGMDGFSRLKNGSFDIVVSDVDMPRMNGFELTSKIRSDREYGDLPVVLVTALASREDRERGIDAGANAYIVKSSFDQSNLLEVMKKLI